MLRHRNTGAEAPQLHHEIKSTSQTTVRCTGTSPETCFQNTANHTTSRRWTPGGGHHNAKHTAALASTHTYTERHTNKRPRPAGIHATISCAIGLHASRCARDRCHRRGHCWGCTHSTPLLFNHKQPPTGCHALVCWSNMHPHPPLQTGLGPAGRSVAAAVTIWGMGRLAHHDRGRADLCPVPPHRLCNHAELGLQENLGAPASNPRMFRDSGGMHVLTQLQHPPTAGPWGAGTHAAHWQRRHGDSFTSPPTTVDWVHRRRLQLPGSRALLAVYFWPSKSSPFTPHAAMTRTSGGDHEITQCMHATHACAMAKENACPSRRLPEHRLARLPPYVKVPGRTLTARTARSSSRSTGSSAGRCRGRAAPARGPPAGSMRAPSARRA